MILGIQRRMVELGRIRTGEKGARGEPRAIKTFRLTSASSSILDAAASVYGGTVTEWEGAPDEGYFQVTTETDTLDAILPPVFSDRDGSPTLPYSQAYEHWGKGGCLKRCDGATEVLSGKPCMCDPDNRECKITTRLNVMLPNLPGLGVWRYESHGWHAATVLPGTLDVLMLASSQQRFIPAVLRIEQRSAKRDGQTHRFSVVVIDLPELRVADLLDATGQPLAINVPSPMPPKPELPAAPAPPGEPPLVADSAPFGDAPELPVEADAVEVEQTETERLVEQVLALAAEFGADVSGVEDAITRNSNLGDPDGHVLWLRRQRDTLTENVAKKKASESSEFAEMARRAGVPV